MLLPSPTTGEVVIPTWNGNEFLMADGARPRLRTLTPRRFDADAQELDVDVVIHGTGPLSEWAASVTTGSLAAISGPGRGYEIHADSSGFLLAGDETAIPAMSQLLEALPVATPVRVLVEVADPAARVPLPEHRLATVEWLDLPSGAPPGDALVTAVRARRAHVRCPHLGRRRGRLHATNPPLPLRGVPSAPLDCSRARLLEVGVRTREARTAAGVVALPRSALPCPRVSSWNERGWC